MLWRTTHKRLKTQLKPTLFLALICRVRLRPSKRPARWYTQRLACYRDTYTDMDMDMDICPTSAQSCEEGVFRV